MEQNAPKALIPAGDFIWSPDERSKVEKVKVELTGSCLTIYRKNQIIQDLAQNMEVHDERTVELVKQDSKIGIRLKGGIECKVLMHISKVIPDSPAAKSGMIFEKDILLHVDGQPVQNKSHDEVVEMLKNAGERFTVHVVKIKSKPEEAEALEAAALETDSTQESSEPSESDTERSTASSTDTQSLLSDVIWMKATEVPLSLTTFTRYQTGNNRLLPNAFQLIPRSGQPIMLHGQDTSTAQVRRWSELLSNKILQLNHEKVQELKEQVFLAEESKPLFLWLVFELLPSTKYNRVWCPKVLVLRQDGIEIFPTIPESVQEWQKPEKKYPISEVIQKELKAEDLPEWRAESIVLQAGSGESHIFAFEFRNVLKRWKQLLKDTTIAAVNRIQRRVFAAKWKNKKVNFCVDVENGFLIEDSNSQEILWRQPFSRLKLSSDNGRSMLHMEFHKRKSKKTCDVQDIEIFDLPIALCVMEAFLTTRVAAVDSSSSDSSL